MKCLHCGTWNSPPVKFCPNCGSELGTQLPTYAWPVANNKWGRLLVPFAIALFVGLGVGSFLFWRTGALRNGSQLTGPEGRKQAAITDSAAVPSGDKSAETIPPGGTEKPGDDHTVAGSDEVPGRTMGRQMKGGRIKAQVRTAQTESLLTPAQADRSSDVTEQTPAIVNSTVGASEVAIKPHRAVQEPDGPSPDLPKPVDTDGFGGTRTPSIVRLGNVPPPDKQTPAVVAPPLPNDKPVKPSYLGANAGLATWTGKLEKDGTLTINSGTASSGVLTGSGLPGVPVRIIIDQTNLGFVEMPSAANGYKKLVLRSHGRHDKITIHWTVIQ